MLSVYVYSAVQGSQYSLSAPTRYGFFSCTVLLLLRMYMYPIHCAGVGGIEAEAVMLGQCISMVLPEVSLPVLHIYMYIVYVSDNDTIDVYMYRHVHVYIQAL